MVAEDNMKAHRHWLLSLTTIAILLGISYVAQADPVTPVKAIPEQRDPMLPRAGALTAMDKRRTPIVMAVARVKDAVVNIHSERTVNGPSSDLFTMGPSNNRVNGMGTGIIIDPRGYIVTNQHVVEDVNVIRVRLADGTTTNATVVSRSRMVDLALLKVNVGRKLAIMPLGTAKDLMVGETVIAIGNAYGYEHTVSRGIVSATKRDVALNKEITYRSLIQTDASINPGNSGGPLVNINGDLVGVNVAIRAGAQGIGFAIPVDTMVKVVSEMMRNQRAQLSDDGMIYLDQVQQTNTGPIRRVVLNDIKKDGAAEAAGLKTGDVLTKVNNVRVMCSYDVDRALLNQKPGQQITVYFNREGQEYKSTLVLKTSKIARPGAQDIVWQKLGAKMIPANGQVVRRVNGQLNGGMEVVSVVSGGAANRAGIRTGDVLVGLHQWEPLSIDNVAFVLSHPDLASFQPLSFYIIRNGQVRRGWIQDME